MYFLNFHNKYAHKLIVCIMNFFRISFNARTLCFFKKIKYQSNNSYFRINQYILARRLSAHIPKAIIFERLTDRKRLTDRIPVEQRRCAHSLNCFSPNPFSQNHFSQNFFPRITFPRMTSPNGFTS